MKKTRIAFYDLSQTADQHIARIKQESEQFQVKTFDAAEGVAARIHQFDPHILVFRHPGNGLELCQALRDRMHFLPLVVTILHEDRSTLDDLQEAGIANWQVLGLSLTTYSFRDILTRIKQEHIDK